jgi:hypothetical protein
MANLRTLTVGDQTFLWAMRWNYDRGGERIVHLVVLHAEAGRRRGQPLVARFIERHAAYPESTIAVLPGDVRACIDLSRARGWDGEHTMRLLPADPLDRPHIVLAAPTRLREWAGEGPLYVAYFPGREHVGPVTEALDAHAVPEAAGGVELQWSSPRGLVLARGDLVSAYTRSVAELAGLLRAVHRRLPGSGASLRGFVKSAPHDPAAAVLPPDHWASAANAVRMPGFRPHDVIWLLDDPDGARIEMYIHHHDAPDRLWLWTTFRASDGSVTDRRFYKK